MLGSQFYSVQEKQSVLRSVYKIIRENNGRKQCSTGHMTKYISRDIMIPRVCSEPTILSLLKAQYTFPRNKRKEKILSYKFFQRCYSNVSYILVAYLVSSPCDSVPTIASGTTQVLLATKGNSALPCQ